MAAAIAIIKTAPAARSFVFFIISLYSGETKSANDSMVSTHCALFVSINGCR